MLKTMPSSCISLSALPEQAGDFGDRDGSCAFDKIRRHDAQNCLFKRHAVRIGALYQFDSVELALRRTDSTTDAHVFIHDDRAATQTTFRFFLDLFFGERTA